MEVIQNDFKWYKKKHVIIKDNWLANYKDLEISKSYYPFETLELPSELAKVENAESAIKFVERYGFLGFVRLHPNEISYKSWNVSKDDEIFNNKKLYISDPIEWFLAQARLVKFVMQYIKALNEGNKEELHYLISNKELFVHYNPNLKYKILMSTAGLEPDLSSKIYFNFPHRSLKVPKIFYSEFLDRAGGQIFLSNIINSNSEGVYRKIKVDFDTCKPKVSYTSNSLIEAIWFIIGNAYINEFEGLNRKGINICEECHTAFIVYDERQKFCNKNCGNRNRARLYREIEKIHKLKREGLTIENIADIIKKDISYVENILKGV